MSRLTLDSTQNPRDGENANTFGFELSWAAHLTSAPDLCILGTEIFLFAKEMIALEKLTTRKCWLRKAMLVASHLRAAGQTADVY